MSDLKSGTPLDKLSKAEKIKVESEGFYGTVRDEINERTAAFSEANVNVLKHHGTYQQDNRDTRRERRKAGLDKEYSMMVRTKTPGGRLTPEAYLLCDDLATKYGQEDMRITSRQGFQFHGVLKGNLRGLIHDLNAFQRITTLGACGDVVRNVMACPVADIDPAFANVKGDLIELAEQISTHFLPKSHAYFDLWLDDEKVRVTENGEAEYVAPAERKPAEEPIYGKQYLPRKFKIGLTIDTDNSIDVYTQDIGVIAELKDGRIAGYEVLAGGGLGHSHSKQDTYARLGSHITYVDADRLLAVLEGIVKVQRDYGNRAERHQARLKYTVDRLGLDEFRRLVGEYAGIDPLPEPKNVRPKDQPDYLGWHKQAQKGLNYVGVWVENGRVKDFEGSFRFRSGLRAIVERFKPSIRLTGHHNVVIANIRDEDVEAVQAMLDEYGIPTDRNIEAIRRHEMACPALPLCGLALSEAEREMPRYMEALTALGHADDDVVIRMTGCPNSCARPETAEIGIIGRGPNKYNFYVGGDRLGTRMNALLKENLTGEQLAPFTAKLLAQWRTGRTNGESFGDWANAQGTEALLAAVDSGGT